MSFTLRVFVGIASLGLTLFFLREVASTVNALLLSYIIVLSASPLLFWLKSKKAPDWLAFVITLVAIAVVFSIFVFLFVAAVNRLAEALPTYAEELESALATIEESVANLRIGQVDAAGFFRILDPGRLLEFALNFLLGLAGTLSNVILVALIVIFLLVDTFNISAKLGREIEAGNAYVRRIATFGSDIRQYVYITTLVGLVTGVLDSIFFLIMGVDFAVLWGILAFMLSYVPTLGFWLAAIPPTFLALLESGPADALIVFVGIVLINGFAENFFKPKYMGSGLNLSPFVVVFSVVFWTGILGPMGAILSIPMTLIVKELILEMDEQNRWMARLMSSYVPGDSAGEDADAPAEPPAVPEDLVS